MEKITMKELVEKYVGKGAMIKLGGLVVNVIIEDVRQSWGRVRFQVSPISGHGSIWVETITLDSQ